MKITIVTLFPEMFDGFLTTSIIKKAILQNLVEIELINIRDFATNKHGRIDTPPVGGGPGLVMQAEPVVKALESVGKGRRVLLTPRGTKFSQNEAFKYSRLDHLVLICGHYEGIDERVNHFIDEEISLGDFIMTGGEVGAMAISDATIRLVDNVIKVESLNEESFNHNLLEYPQYTEPYSFRGLTVPLILYSGHHAAIRKWRLKQSLLITYKKRPDIYAGFMHDKTTKRLLNEALNDEVGVWETKAIAQGKKFTNKED